MLPKDIKKWCIENNKSINYRKQKYYLFGHKIYDADMNIIIDNAENGFLDLFEYYEYFPQNINE